MGHFRFKVNKVKESEKTKYSELSIAPDKVLFSTKEYWARLFKANDVVS